MVPPAGGDDRRPAALQRLLTLRNPASREQAWDELIERYSKLLMHVARMACRNHDGAMDRYAAILEHLRADDFKRLRAFSADGRSEFSTWLVVVSQRICIDFHRQLYGRSRNGASDPNRSDDDRVARRRLIELLNCEIDIASLATPDVGDPESTVRSGDLLAALEAALQQLTPPERLLIKLRFEDGLSVPEIAQTLEIPTRFHVYRQMTAVLGRLRTALAKNGVYTAAP